MIAEEMIKYARDIVAARNAAKPDEGPETRTFLVTLSGDKEDWEGFQVHYVDSAIEAGTNLIVTGFTEIQAS